MFCCTNCFTDSEIKAIIDGNKQSGDCDFCGSKNVHVYDIEKDQTIAEMFEGLLDVYTPIKDLPSGFPRERADIIGNILCENWQIFNNLERTIVYQFITSICSNRYKEQPELFDGEVGIKQSQDPEYLEKNSILKSYRWEDFVEEIKHENRFHGDYINTDMLFVFLRCAVKSYSKGDVMYRARISPDGECLSVEEIGAPPKGKGRGGRVNPEGVSILYLSDSEVTTLYEIRAGIHDYVTIGSFELQKDIEVINLAGIDQISPFIGVNYDFDLTQYAINIEHLKKLALEIATPHRNDNMLDYLPTQYVSDYIRSKKYAGIEYMSTMLEGSANLAVYDPSLFECKVRSVHKVKKISYEYTHIATELTHDNC